MAVSKSERQYSCFTLARVQLSEVKIYFYNLLRSNADASLALRHSIAIGVGLSLLSCDVSELVDTHAE